MKFRLSTLFVFTISIISSCGDRGNYVPHKMTKIDDFHCWPYDVQVFEIEDFKCAEQLEDCPSVSLRDKHYLLNWQSLSIYQQTNKDSLITRCDDEFGDLTTLKNDFSGCYVSGIYRKLKTKDNVVVDDFTSLAVLDSIHGKLYLFENINYHY